MKHWDTAQWNRLLSFIDAGMVIPILGREVGRLGGGDAYDLARKIARRLKLSLKNLSTESPFNDLALRELAARGSTQNLYLEIYRSLEETPIEPSDAQKRLAEIAGFQLYLTTGFDHSLEAALREARGLEPGSLAFAENNIEDIKLSPKAPARPLVYHLLGRVGVGPTYCVTEEDTLEFFHALLRKPPHKLFMELVAKHLLIIGGGYGDWLARFFLRASKGQRLSMPRNVSETIACQTTARDLKLLQFLSQFSTPTTFFAEVDPVAFITELHLRWLKRKGRHRPTAVRPAQPPPPKPPQKAKMPAKAVFISYAREDLKAVENLHAGLVQHGVSAWFDFKEISAADHFGEMIKRNIEASRLFIPVISQHTSFKGPRVFKKEWNLAIARTSHFLPTESFIVPVAVDGTDQTAHWLPDEILEPHWTQLPNGVITNPFIEKIRKLLRAYE